MVDTIIAGGEVVTSNGVFPASLAIEEGKIVAVGKEEQFSDSDTRIDASGLLVMPGIVDPHVHMDYDPPQRIAQYKTETAAAALGGVTTCIDFARPNSDDHTLLKRIQQKQEKAEEAIVDFSVHGMLTSEEDLSMDLLEAAIEAGVTSFKMFTVYDLGVSNGFINRALENVSDLGAVALVHTEDESICTELTNRLKNENKNEAIWYPKSRPDYAEAMAADDVARMAKEAGAKYYGVHATCEESCKVIDEHRENGELIRAETCTHYTALDEYEYQEQNMLPVIAPPLRTASDVDSIFEYIKNGTISVVSSDHVVQKHEDKTGDKWWDVSFGANGLQTELPVFHEVAVNKRGLSYPDLVQLKCTNPAQTFGLLEKGTLDPGTDADIVLFDPNESYNINSNDNESNADYSIYDGMNVTGKVKKTFVRGDLVAENGTVVGEEGTGNFIKRNLPNWQK